MNFPFLDPRHTRIAGATLLLFPLHASFDSSCLFLNGVPVPALPCSRLLYLLLLLLLLPTFEFTLALDLTLTFDPQPSIA